MPEYLVTKFPALLQILVLLTSCTEIHSVAINSTRCLGSCEEPVPAADAEDWQSPSKDLPLPNVHSPLYLTQLVKYEAFVAGALWNLAQSNLFQPKLLTRINEYLAFYMDDGEFVFENEQRERIVSKNPILSLNMIWRFANQISVIHKYIQQEVSVSQVSNGPERDFILDVDAIPKWPTEETVEEAMESILRIQMVYDLDPSELSSGIILGQKVGPHLAVPIMYNLAKFASKNRMYTLAVPWFELVWDKLEEQKTMIQFKAYHFSLKDVIQRMITTMLEHDMNRPRRGMHQYFFFQGNLLYPNRTFVEERFPLRQHDFSYLQRHKNPAFNQVNYWSLCSGDNHQTRTEKAKLTCFYDQTTDPVLYISPIKKEILSNYPYIVQMYDVINEKTIKRLRDLANKQELVRSRVFDIKSHGGDLKSQDGQISKIRTSVGTFIEDPVLELDKLVEASTGLSVISLNSSEPYLMASYAFGGHYDCHLDTFAPELEPTPAGNRIATMMFYLDEPEMGGGTAFPQAGITAKPIKGSAILWYNMKQNGETDQNTHHCACPVILSRKTIVTKWIRHNDQFKRRPCALREDF